MHLWALLILFFTQQEDENLQKAAPKSDVSHRNFATDSHKQHALNTQEDENQEETSAFSVSNHQFAADLYKQYALNAEGGVDFLISPLSVQLALAMVHSGAGGLTAEEIARALHLPNDKQKIEQSVNGFLSNFKKTQNYTLESANKLFVDNRNSLDQSFKKNAERFKGEVEAVDFQYPAKIAKNINNWLALKSEGKIRDAVDAGLLGEDIQSFMVSSLFFRGKWALKFNKSYTSPGTFIDSDQQRKPKPMMKTTGWFKYYYNPELKARFLQLDYSDNTTMTIVLPSKSDGLPDLQTRVEEVLAEQNYTRKKMRVSVPKFTMETTTGMAVVLMELGIQQAFTPRAELGITKEPLAISTVFQKSVFEVDEAGTLVPPDPDAQEVFATSLFVDKAPQIVVNHPFLFFVKVSEVVAFIGQYTG